MRVSAPRPAPPAPPEAEDESSKAVAQAAPAASLPSARAVAAVAALALTFGAANSLLSASLLATACAPSCGGGGGGAGAGGAAFARPLFATLVAFCAQAACAPAAAAISMLRRCAARAKPRDTGAGGGEAAARLLGGDAAEAAADADGGEIDSAASSTLAEPAFSLHLPSRSTLLRALSLWLPALLDVVSTAAATGALLFVSASVSTATRGALLLFSALAARACGVRDGAAGRAEWAGVALSSGGVVLVGLGAVLAAGVSGAANGAAGSDTGGSGLSPAASTAAGIALGLAGNAVMSAQVVLETRIIEAAAFAPAAVNSIEGVLGAVMLAVALAVAQAVRMPGGAPFEDSIGTGCCIASTPSIAWQVAALFAAFAASTAAHMELSAMRGSNFRSTVIVARVLLVWAAELVFEYAPGALSPGAAADDFSARYGVPWTSWSWLQAAGCAALAAGAVVSWRGQDARQLAAGADTADELVEEGVAGASSAGKQARVLALAAATGLQ